MDNSFINLTKDEYINRIDIDPRLVDSFKRVMYKIQEYFNANGYSKERDYAKYFEEYLFDNKFSIQLNDEPSKDGASGFYRKQENRICIDIKHIDDEELDSILCHEFIHFLVMHGLKFGKCDTSIYIGGFINEALTEMLNQQIYPNSRAYEPQVTMLKYVNELAGKVNNYSLFLKGYIDGHGYGSSWCNFISYVEKYHIKFEDKGYRMSDAIKDEDYIAGQWEIIDSFIILGPIKSIDDYVEKFKLLINRPVIDFEVFNKKVNKMMERLISNLGLKNYFEYEFLRKKLIQLSNNLLNLNKYDGKDVYTFELSGYEFAITKDGKVLNMVPGIQLTSNSYNNIVNIKYKGDEINIDLSKVDFTVRRKKLQSNIKTICHYFDKDSKEDLIAISKVVNKDNLISLKKYKLPQVGEFENKKATIIYIAQYPDRIEILGDYQLIGTIDNIELNKYIGLTSRDNGLICFNKIREIDKGYVISKLNPIQINNACRNLLIKQIENNITEENLEKIINLYKNSDSYEENPTDLEGDAIYWYADSILKEMDEFSRKDLIDKVIIGNDKFVISNGDTGISVSLLFGEQNLSAFITEEQTLININGFGLYNGLYSELIHNNSVEKKDNRVISFSFNSGMVFDEYNNVNYRLYVLEYLHKNVCYEIENIIKNKNSIEDYKQQIEILLNQRDDYQNRIDEILNKNKKVM